MVCTGSQALMDHTVREETHMDLYPTRETVYVCVGVEVWKTLRGAQMRNWTERLWDPGEPLGRWSHGKTVISGADGKKRCFSRGVEEVDSHAQWSENNQYHFSSLIQGCFFFKISFIYHKIHTFTAYNSMVCIYSQVYAANASNSRIFSPLSQQLCTLSRQSLFYPPPTTANLLSTFKDLPVLDISNTWTHTTCDLLSLVSFAPLVFKAQPCWSRHQ